MTTEPTGPKQRGRPFERGQSGNPSGRAKGSRNRVLVALDKIGADAAAEVLKATVTTAKGGDLGAASLILSRVWPARKGRPVVLDLPAMTCAADLPAVLGAVAQAVAGGELTPEEGQALAGVLECQRRAIETADLAERLAALEAKQEK
jgi:hypothetical protein